MKKIIYKNTIETIAISSAIITILLAFLSDSFTDFIKPYEIQYFIGFLLLNGGIILFRNRTKNDISLKMTDTVKLNIFYDDIFTQEGIIVIPVNEYFDTIVDDKIISSKTVHGIFIKQVFGGDEQNLKSKIKKSLKNETSTINEKRTNGNKLKYPLGTVAQVEKKGKIYFLVVLTRFNENNRAEIKKEEYQIVLTKLLNFTEQFSQGKVINIPLIGGGHSGVKLSKQKLLEFLLMSIHLNDNLTMINGINIVLHSSNKNEIDLNSLEYLYKVMKD